MKEIILFAGYLIPVFLLVGGTFAEETSKHESPKFWFSYSGNH